MSVHPALRRLFRLGAAAAVAAERLRAPEPQFERLQAGLEGAGFDAADPLAPLLGGVFSGDSLAGTLARLARPAVEPEAMPGATERPRSPRSADGVVSGSARAFEPLANPRLARLLQAHAQPGAHPAGAAPAVPAAARVEATGRAIGAAQAAATLARRAMEAGADSAWTEPVRAPQTEATNALAATGAARQPAVFDEARVANGAAGSDPGIAAASAQESAGVRQRLERLVERVASVRGRARTDAGRPARARVVTGIQPDGAGAQPRAAEPLGAGGAEFDRGYRFSAAGGGTEARAQGRFDPPGGGRVGGFRGLAALARNRGGDQSATGEWQPAAGPEAMPAAPAWPAAPQAPAERSAAAGFAPSPDAAPEGRDGEALARELTRLLRREAERHGIDLDGVGP